MCVLHVRCVCMLAGNEIGAAGAERLAAALEKNSSLTQLDLEGEWHGMWERQEMARCAYPYLSSAQHADRTLSPLQRQAAPASGGE